MSFTIPRYHSATSFKPADHWLVEALKESAFGNQFFGPPLPLGFKTEEEINEALRSEGLKQYVRERIKERLGDKAGQFVVCAY